MKDPFEFAEMLRNTARFRPGMEILKESADMIEMLANKLVNHDYHFENGERYRTPFEKELENGNL